MFYNSHSHLHKNRTYSHRKYNIFMMSVQSISHIQLYLFKHFVFLLI